MYPLLQKSKLYFETWFCLKIKFRFLKMSVHKPNEIVQTPELSKSYSQYMLRMSLTKYLDQLPTPHLLFYSQAVCTINFATFRPFSLRFPKSLAAFVKHFLTFSSVIKIRYFLVLSSSFRLNFLKFTLPLKYSEW